MARLECRGLHDATICRCRHVRVAGGEASRWAIICSGVEKRGPGVRLCEGPGGGRETAVGGHAGREEWKLQAARGSIG